MRSRTAATEPHLLVKRITLAALSPASLPSPFLLRRPASLPCTPPPQTGLALNVDMAATAMLEPLELVDYMWVQG